MAVRKGNFTETEGDITITNGDFQALRKIAEEYGLADESDVIAFAIGILDQSGGQGVIIRREDGTPVRLMPSDSIRRTQT